MTRFWTGGKEWSELVLISVGRIFVVVGSSGLEPKHSTPRRTYLKISLGIFALLLVAGAAIYLSLGRDTVSQPRFFVRVGGQDVCFLAKGGAREGGFTDLGIEVAKSVIVPQAAMLGDYLKQAAASTSSPLEIATTTVNLFQFSADKGAASLNLKCMVIANGPRGSFDANHPPGALLDETRRHRFDPDGLFVRDAGSGLDTSLLAKLGFSDFPYSYFEFLFEPDDTGLALRLVPAVSYFRESVATRSKQAPKDIEISVLITSPTSVGSLGTGAGSNGLIAEIPAVFKSLRPGQLSRSPVGDMDTVWISAPLSPDRASVDKIVAREKATNTDLLSLFPANVVITYRENDGPDRLLYHLGESLGSVASHSVR